MTDLTHFTPRPRPGQSPLFGDSVTLEPADWRKHGQALFRALGGTNNPDLWTYIAFGPFTSAETFSQTMQIVAQAKEWEVMIICEAATGHVLGTASYMRIRESAGSAEVGCVLFGPGLQKTRAASEAIYLMAKHVFEDLGYRRYEWKCDNLNAASKRAALRYGFQYEGLFRQDLVVKGKNRDTAWFAMIDTDWPEITAGFEAWLAPENFDASGLQKYKLADLRKAIAP